MDAMKQQWQSFVGLNVLLFITDPHRRDDTVAGNGDCYELN